MVKGKEEEDGDDDDGDDDDDDYDHNYDYDCDDGVWVVLVMLVTMTILMMMEMVVGVVPKSVTIVSDFIAMIKDMMIYDCDDDVIVTLLVLLMTTMAIWSLMGLPMLILRRAATSAGRGMSGSAQSSLLLLVMSVVVPEWPWKSISGMQQVSTCQVAGGR